MKAKDTVMEISAIRELFREFPKIGTVADLNKMFQHLAEAQARLTLKEVDEMMTDGVAVLNEEHERVKMIRESDWLEIMEGIDGLLF